MVIPEKPQAARSEISSWFFKCKHTSALILRTWQTAIFTSKAPALVVCCPVWGHPRGCCPATSGTSCGRNLGVIDRILNEWCDPFVSAARLNEWFTTNFGAADELTADYRAPRRRAADCGGAGRTATGIGREKGVERLLLGRGPYLATPTSARNAPSDTPGDRARAGHCVSGLFCVRDDLAEIAAIKGRG